MTATRSKRFLDRLWFPYFLISACAVRAIVCVCSFVLL